MAGPPAAARGRRRQLPEAGRRTPSSATLDAGRHSSTTCQSRAPAAPAPRATASGTHQGGRSPAPAPQRCAPAAVNGACARRPAPSRCLAPAGVRGALLLDAREAAHLAARTPRHAHNTDRPRVAGAHTGSRAAAPCMRSGTRHAPPCVQRSRLGPRECHTPAARLRDHHRAPVRAQRGVQHREARSVRPPLHPPGHILRARLRRVPGRSTRRKGSEQAVTV